MKRPPHSAPAERAVPEAFDYTPLGANFAHQLQTAAQRMRQMVKRTLNVLIEVGDALRAVKHALPHGTFGLWLRAEFGWTERTARSFMAVAERFGSKAEIIADMQIDPTAAYLLARPSVPEEASQVALRRAEDGERITVAVAREILRNIRKKQKHSPRNAEPVQLSPKLLGRLLASLESFRREWEPHVSVLAQELRQFADSLEEE